MSSFSFPSLPVDRLSSASCLSRSTYSRSSVESQTSMCSRISETSEHSQDQETDSLVGSLENESYVANRVRGPSIVVFKPENEKNDGNNPKIKKIVEQLFAIEEEIEVSRRLSMASTEESRKIFQEKQVYLDKMRVAGLLPGLNGLVFSKKNAEKEKENARNAEAEAEAAAAAEAAEKLEFQRLQKEREFLQKMSLLKIGQVMKKYKHSSSPKKRLIWIDSKLEVLSWGTEDKKIKGSILVRDIIRIDEGCDHAENQNNAFELVTKDRTLELEAYSFYQKCCVIEALTELKEKREIEEEKH